MPAYDSNSFDPPAPLARVTVRNAANGTERADVPVLLDWGADVTLLPQGVAKGLGAQVISGKQYELIGFDGSKSFAPVVNLELEFAGKTFRGQFLVIDQEWGILGRNVLNSLAILCDGPRLVWEVRGDR